MERLIRDGKMAFVSAAEIDCSRIGIGFEKLDRDVFDPRKAYDKVAKIGVKRIRIQSGWMKTERVKGVYDFAWLDEIVDNLLLRGLEPWLCLCYGNPLYTTLAESVFGAVGCPPVENREETEAWLRYVEAAVKHFKGKISLYEIWNEPDCSYSWKHLGEAKEDIDPERNAREYGLFACETARAIKKADAEAQVAAFGLCSISNLKWVNDALSTGLYQYVDYVSFHIYASDDGLRARWISSLRDLVHSYNPDIRLIQGESGAQTRSDGNGAMRGFAWTREKQTKMLLRTLICDLHEGVAFTSYFSTMDMIEALRGKVGDKASYLDYGYFGVISAEFDEDGRATGEYTEKPSYYALSALASLLRGNACAKDIPYAVEELPSKRVNGSDCACKDIQVYSFSLDDGGSALIYWKKADILTETYEGTASFCVYGQKLDRIRICNLKDGGLYRLPEGMTEALGNGGIRLRNIPITDSPLAILFE